MWPLLAHQKNVVRNRDLLHSLHIHLNERAELLEQLEANFKNLLEMELTSDNLSASSMSKYISIFFIVIGMGCKKNVEEPLNQPILYVFLFVLPVQSNSVPKKVSRSKMKQWTIISKNEQCICQMTSTTIHLMSEKWKIHLLLKSKRARKQAKNLKTSAPRFCMDLINVWSLKENNFKKIKWWRV